MPHEVVKHKSSCHVKSQGSVVEKMPWSYDRQCGDVVRVGAVRIVWCALTLLAAGCGMAQQYKLDQEAQAAEMQMNREKAECERQYSDAHARPASPRIACLSAAIVKYHEAMDRSIGDPSLDLVRRLHAQLAVIAEKYDRSSMSVAQFELAKADAISEYMGATRQRANNATMARAAVVQAAAAVDANSPTTCSKIGNSVTCY